MDLVFKCDTTNDLYRVLSAMGLSFPRYDSTAEAVAAAPNGAGVLVLADQYPQPTETIGEELLDRAAAKGLRLYVEYPQTLAGLDLGEPKATQWERVVVASDFFAPGVEPMAVLAQHGCWFLPAQAAKPHMVVVKVAGYRQAAFGLPDERWPILFELPGRPVLVATSKLSQFVTARYGPIESWKVIWERILGWLGGATDVPCLKWSPAVDVEFGPEDPLPNDVEVAAFARSAKWFADQVVASIDWKKFAIEGFEAIIDHEGRQMVRPWIRGDCTGESAMVFAWDWAVTRNPNSRRTASAMLDYVWSAPDFRHDDPESPSYGLNNWSERNPAFYGDDNARVIMPSMVAAKLLGETRWDEHILRCTLANFRTTGPLGFRESRLDYPGSFTDGRDWAYWYEHETVSYSPHYQAYPWAMFLWTHALTGHEQMLARTKTALRMTMEVYPKLKWTNGLTQEMARLLLPLAFLVRIEDTAQHRQWLNRVADDLLAQMQPCGAIRELLGPLADGSYPPPQSNERYGTDEASLIQENGDPACDLLYTTNYALLGLHEAAAATGDRKLTEAADRLTRFLCRIQVRSTAQPYLSGAWMRAFDYELWEYWGSSADLGWGAWCVETGWTNAWIAAVLAMRQKGESLFDLALASRFKQLMPKLIAEMFDRSKGKKVTVTPVRPTSVPGAEQ
ncbi:MAG: hypothetical protein GXY33_20355 [Phycisphaerae bacterium]|nr:hypothetical protein [Phycisphaerae bacterium]